MFGASECNVCAFLFRLIDPQTQVTRLRVRWCVSWDQILVAASDIFLVVSNSLLFLIYRPLLPPSSSTSSHLLQFPLSSVVQCSSHQDNKRLFGFVLQSVSGRSDSRAVCYIFESNNDGEKVVHLGLSLCPTLCLSLTSHWHACLLPVL